MLGRKDVNILVIKADSLAGFIAAEPSLEAIRQHHQNAKISLLTAPSLQRIARVSPYFDQVALMPNFAAPEEKKEFIRQLKASKFERVYDLTCNDASRKLQNAMRWFGPKWFCAAPPKGRGKSQPVQLGLPNFDAMFASAGLEADTRLPNLHWAIEARKDSANMKPAWYGVAAPFGLLLPGLNESQRWSAEGYSGLASLMAHTGFMPVLAGAKELHGFADTVAHDAPQLVDLTGKTDHLQLAALARDAAFFVTDDAEEMQLAVSVNCQGVMVLDQKSDVTPPEGRHVVTLRFDQDPASVKPDFIWRTLTNMGLTTHSAQESVSA